MVKPLDKDPDDSDIKVGPPEDVAVGIPGIFHAMEPAMARGPLAVAVWIRTGCRSPGRRGSGRTPTIVSEARLKMLVNRTRSRAPSSRSSSS